MLLAGVAYFVLCKPGRLDLYSNGVQLSNGARCQFLPLEEIADFSEKSFNLHLNGVYNNTLFWFKFTDATGKVFRYNCHAMFGSEKQKNLQAFSELLKSNNACV